MKVTLVAPDVSGNCMGRVAILARVAARFASIEIVGPAFRGTVWGPLADSDLPIRALPFGFGSHHALRIGTIASAIDGDVVVACKPLATSLKPALARRARGGPPVVVDVDDLDSGFCRELWNRRGPIGRLRYLASSVWRPHGSLSLLNAPRWERRVDRADAVWVSNHFLQRRFGGDLVWHGRDTRAWDPADHDAATARSRHGVPEGAPVVAFFGTPTAYKGVGDLIDALAEGVGEARLLLAGAGDSPEDRAWVARAREVLGDRVIDVGRVAFAAAPSVLAMADVVAVPQRQSAATCGQMPAKLFDAMALGRPVVATAVSDIPWALSGCGWVVPAGEPRALAAALAEALAQPDEAARRGRAARARAIERFSHDAMERTIRPTLERLAGGIDAVATGLARPADGGGAR